MQRDLSPLFDSERSGKSMHHIDVEGLLFRIPITEAAPDFEVLASSVMPGCTRSLMIGRRDELRDHILDLSREFAGESQLCFYHAVLIVLIRRNLMREAALRHFSLMWDTQADHLLATLSSRWLVSACDTIMDCSEDPCERAFACAGSTLMNTIKLYETERLASPSEMSAIEHSKPTPLFDGMTSFSVGYGDMIQSLRSRTSSVCAGGGVAARILVELLKRVDRFDTVYRRLAELHRNEATRWV